MITVNLTLDDIQRGGPCAFWMDKVREKFPDGFTNFPWSKEVQLAWMRDGWLPAIEYADRYGLLPAFKVMTGQDFHNVRWDGYESHNLLHWTFRSCRFTSAMVRNHTFVMCDFRFTDLGAATWEGCIFRQCLLSDLNYQPQGIRLDGCITPSE
jgi:hypothetical protein